VIFVTAGTTPFQFVRLERLVIRLSDLYPGKKILFQIRNLTKSDFASSVMVKDSLSQDRFTDVIKKAEIIVTHAGFATIMQILQNAKTKPLVMPRLKKYNEHVNDHQLYFVRFMEKKGLVSLVRNSRNIKNLIDKNVYDRGLVEKYLREVNIRKRKLVNYHNSLT